jgi:hypothetical protein
MLRAVAVLLVLVLIDATPSPTPTPGPRHANSVVMDVDLTEEAAGGGSDELDIIGTIELILDRVAARTAPLNSFRQRRSILWLPVNGNRECQDPDDAGILEIYVARFVQYTHEWVVVGLQHAEVDLSFELLSCSGKVLLRFPGGSAEYASASFSPYFISLGGAAAVVELSTAARQNNLNTAAVVTAVNSYGPLQTNIGMHDPTEAQELALFRMIGNIPGTDVPPPAPGTVASLLEQCRFTTSGGGAIGLACGK